MGNLVEVLGMIVIYNSGGVQNRKLPRYSMT